MATLVVNRLVTHSQWLNAYFVGVAIAFAIRLAVRPIRYFRWLTCAGTAVTDVCAVIGWTVGELIYVGLGQLWGY